MRVEVYSTGNTRYIRETTYNRVWRIHPTTTSPLNDMRDGCKGFGESADALTSGNSADCIVLSYCLSFRHTQSTSR